MRLIFSFLYVRGIDPIIFKKQLTVKFSLNGHSIDPSERRIVFTRTKSDQFAQIEHKSLRWLELRD